MTEEELWTVWSKDDHQLGKLINKDVALKALLAA